MNLSDEKGEYEMLSNTKPFDFIQIWFQTITPICLGRIRLENEVNFIINAEADFLPSRQPWIFTDFHRSVFRDWGKKS